MQKTGPQWNLSTLRHPLKLCQSRYFHVEGGNSQPVLVWSGMIFKELCYFEDPTGWVCPIKPWNLKLYMVKVWCRWWWWGRVCWRRRCRWVLIVLHNGYALEKLVKSGHDVMLSCCVTCCQLSNGFFNTIHVWLRPSGFSHGALNEGTLNESTKCVMNFSPRI